MSAPDPPPVPGTELESGGWELEAERTETLFELPTMRIRGTTRQYEDARSRAALREATEGRVDTPVRFFAATRLGFEPPPPPGVGPTMFAPTMRTEIRRSFATELEDRGLTDIERGRSERLRLPDRNRARLTKYTARDDHGEWTLPLECWVGVWTDRNDVFVVSGGHPEVGLADHFGIEANDDELARSPGNYRDEFFSLLRGVAQ
jgi:hypothetical protein